MEQIKVIQGGLSVDERGSVRFVNDFNFKDVKRFYQVENHSKNMIRGWHGHKKEAKYVYVIRGSILIGVVPLSWDSNGEFFDKGLDCSIPISFTLSSDKPSVLYIPPNYANGFMTLTDNAIIQFFSTCTLAESLDDDYRFPYNQWDIWNIKYR